MAQPIITTAAGNGRLESLDMLRGLDLFMLVGLQPVLVAAGDEPSLAR